MTSPAIQANDCFTSSITTTIERNGAQIAYLGAYSAKAADAPIWEPEDAIDYDAGAASLLAAGNVSEADSPVVSSSSPFGI